MLFFLETPNLGKLPPSPARSLSAQKGLVGLRHGASGQWRGICIKVVSREQPLLEALQRWKGHSPTWQRNPNGELLCAGCGRPLYSADNPVKEGMTRLLLVKLRQLAAHRLYSLPDQRQDNCQLQPPKVLRAGCSRCSRQRSGSLISAKERSWGTCHSLQYFLKRSKSISRAQPFRQFCGSLYNFPLERWERARFLVSFAISNF